MSMYRWAIPLSFFVAWVPSAAEAAPVPALQRPSSATFSEYWRQGEAELTSYTLKQARYGEIHEGHAVLVFVTEPFSRSKQVKLDSPQGAGPDRVEVLKLNHTRKFNTGIYPYSVMRSVFTPLDGTPTLKLNALTQEWCGHVFMQLNLRGDGQSYEGPLLSYFESEGDRTVSVSGAHLEDDVWTILRIDPARLPRGTIKMVPSSTYLRLRHQPVVARTAKAQWVKTGGSRWVYEVAYTDIDRTLRIEIEGTFPYRIVNWEETYPSGWGFAKGRLRTVGERMKTIKSAYWTKNKNRHRQLRKDLGLSPD